MITLNKIQKKIAQAIKNSGLTQTELSKNSFCQRLKDIRKEKCLS